MKKRLSIILLALSVTAAVLTGCGTKDDTVPLKDTTEQESEGSASNADNKELKTIKVGATPAPHAEILAEAKGLLVEEGYDLQIVEYVDYVQPNLALDGGDLDANFFQHEPYLNQFNEERGTDLVSAGFIHYEPFAIYRGKTASLEELAEGAKIAVPNDATNEARALLLLEKQGLLTLREGAGLKATKKDIVQNPKKFEIVEMEAAQLPRVLTEVDAAVINGNYALAAGLKVENDSLAVEDTDSVGASTYRNVVVVKAGNENSPEIAALMAVLQSEKMKEFITTTYEGAVVPLF